MLQSCGGRAFGGRLRAAFASCFESTRATAAARDKSIAGGRGRDSGTQVDDRMRVCAYHATQAFNTPNVYAESFIYCGDKKFGDQVRGRGQHEGSTV